VRIPSSVDDALIGLPAYDRPMADIFEMKSSHILYSNDLYHSAWRADAHHSELESGKFDIPGQLCGSRARTPIHDTLTMTNRPLFDGFHSPSPTGRSSGAGGADNLELGEFQQALLGELYTDTGLLRSAERNGRHQFRVFVYPDHSRIQPPGNLLRPLGVRGPNGRA
jgi:hypothetical protein